MRLKGTRRQSANLHGTRQSGLAQPGKRIEKVDRQRSNGQLNGEPQLSASLRFQRMPLQHGSLASSEEAPPEVTQVLEENLAPHNETEANGSSEPFLDARKDLQNGEVMQTAEIHGQRPRKIDVNATQNPAVHLDSGPLHLVATILRACPLADTLAILIILLQIPVAILTVVHFLFVTLTFVPPSGSTISSFPALGDFFQGSGGTPSMATTAITDLVFFTAWLFLWTPAQDLALDLSQAVIAVSLGGRFGGKDHSFRSTVMCLCIIIVSHLGRCRCFRLPWLDTSMSVKPPSPINSMPWVSMLRYSALRSRKSWLRTVLAVHVLAQGAVRSVRRWLSRQDRTGSSYSSKMDCHDNTVNAGGHIDKLVHGPIATGNIGVHEIQSPFLTITDVKDGKDKMVDGKRRKKQSTHVRSYQPLWAAVASTKTIVMKEYEHTNVSAEAVGAEAKDLNNLGNACFESEEGTVWTTRIATTEISLQCSFFDILKQPASDPNGDEELGAHGNITIESFKPFHVRINGADWPSTRIHEIKEHSGSNKGGCWAVEIYGLAPGSNYTCAFIRTQDGATVQSLNLTTLQVPTADAAINQNTSSPATQNSARPSSPKTTLRVSIATAEAKLEEERGVVKKVRKEHKVLTTSLKKEVDASSMRFAHSGSNDDRQRQRLLQFGQNIRQAEDAAAAITIQAEAMGSVPEQDSSESQESKDNYDTFQHRHSDARMDLSEITIQSNHDLATIQSEATNVRQKRERVQARHIKLSDQYDRLNNTNIENSNPNDHKIDPQTTRDDEWHLTEDNYVGQSRVLHDNLKDIRLNSQHLWQQIHSIDSAYWDHHQRALSAPTTPEGNLPSTTTATRNTAVPRYGQFVFPSPAAQASPSFQPSLPSSRATSGYHEGRARSSSMLSNISNFTDFVDASAMPADLMVNGKAHTSREMARGDGGPSGSRSRSGSHRAPSSPFPMHSVPYAAAKGDNSGWW